MVDILVNVGKTLLGIIIIVLLLGIVLGFIWLVFHRTYIALIIVVVPMISFAGYKLGDTLVDFILYIKRGE